MVSQQDQQGFERWVQQREEVKQGYSPVLRKVDGETPHLDGRKYSETSLESQLIDGEVSVRASVRNVCTH